MIKNYKYHPNIILRTPLKPLKSCFSKDDLYHFFSSLSMQEALFLASPNLLTECKKWLNGEVTEKNEEEKLVFSLLKYALRMHSRCTPYGLFAGCGVIEEISDAIIINTQKIERNTRLDMNYTCALAQELTRWPFLQYYLKFYPNTSIYNLKDKVRYVEYHYKDNRRIHQISAVDNSVYLQTILQKAQHGASLNELAQSITNEEINTTDALEFLKEIVAAQLIVSELEPAVTGDEPLTQILKSLLNIHSKNIGEEQLINLEEVTQLQNIITLLQDVQIQLIQIDDIIGNDINVYKNIAEKLKQLNIIFDLSKLFQTDKFISTISSSNLTKPNYLTIEDERSNNKSILLQKAITVLNQLTDISSKTYLTEFKRKFYERYGDKEIALQEVLDNETGIGYAQNTNQRGDINPLVNDLRLPFGNNQATELNWGKKDSFLFQKLISANQNKQQIIQINSNEINEFKTNWNDLPDSFSVIYKHLGKRKGIDLLSITSVGGSSALNLLGRFASNNIEIEKIVFEIAEQEQENQPDVIFAEIVHLPESRTGNVLMRPTFRNYEIPYLAKSSLPQEQQILLNDLYISIKNNQIYLRSKRLNKQVIPRLGNAHNYSFNALPVYQFLCDLQTQNQRSGLFFDWGSLKNEFSFLPRVEVDNVIISFATWQLRKEQYQELIDKKESISAIVKKWQKKFELPDLVLLVDGDNELLINLGNELSLGMFVSEIRKRFAITLKEFLFDERTAIVKDEQGNTYTNEFIAILQKQSFINLSLESKLGNVLVHSSQFVRTFSLGSEWLYYKIYCGIKTADKILTDVIKPLTENLIREQLIDSWFFIRYADPESHLRVRFHFTDLVNVGIVVQLFQQAIIEYEQIGLVWKIQTDTYQREIERYGVNTMVLSEKLFYHNSKCIVNLLEMIEGDEGEDIRWLFAIKSVDTLLNNFNYSMKQKIELMENLKIEFAHEFNMNKDLKMQLDKKFRIYREPITKVLNVENNETSDLQPLFEFLKQESENIKSLITEILIIQQNNQLQLQLNDLLASYIHMLLNRLFKSKQRMHEMVIYDIMWRSYRSQIAIQQQKQLVD